MFREGKIDDRLLEAQLEEVRARRDQVRAELENCEAAVTEAAAAKSVEEAIRDFCDQIQDGIEEATFEERQTILRRMVECIEVEPDGHRGTPGVVGCGSWVVGGEASAGDPAGTDGPATGSGRAGARVRPREC